jgi:hypothetical protein
VPLLNGVRYPMPRLDRRRPGEGADLGGGLLDGAAPVPARSRLWPYFLFADPNLRSTAVSVAFHGPALLYHFGYTLGNPPNSEGGLSLLWSEEETGAQTNGAMSPAPSGTQVFARPGFRQAGTNDPDEVLGHIPVLPMPGLAHRPIPLRYLISSRNNFFLKVSLRGILAGQINVNGEVLVLEGDEVDDLLSFMD